MKLIYDEEVETYLIELVKTLFEKEYFGFKESAYDYTD